MGEQRLGSGTHSTRWPWSHKGSEKSCRQTCMERRHPSCFRSRSVPPSLWSCHPGRGTAVSTGSGDGMWASLGSGFILSTPQGLFQWQTGLGNMTSLQSLLLRPSLARRAAAVPLPSPPLPLLSLPLLPSLLPLLPSPFPPPLPIPVPCPTGGRCRGVERGEAGDTLSIIQVPRRAETWSSQPGGLPVSRWWGQWGEEVG